MPARRRISPTDGKAALAECLALGEGAPRAVVATAVRYLLEELAARHPRLINGLQASLIDKPEEDIRADLRAFLPVAPPNPHGGSHA